MSSVPPCSADCPECGGKGLIGGDAEAIWACTVWTRRQHQQNILDGTIAPPANLIHRVGWEISNAAAEEMRAQGFSGGWDHDALANHIAGAAIRATGAEAMRSALEHYAVTYCEGWCTQADRPSHLDCGGCLARRVLAQVSA